MTVALLAIISLLMILTAGTVILNNNKVLLLKNKGSDEQNGRWGPPAGHGESGESLTQTAIRETKEETNLDVSLKRLIQVGYFNYHGKNYIFALYLAKAKDLSTLKIQKNEVSSYAWVSLKELINNKYIFRKKFLKEPVMLAFNKKTPVDNLIKNYLVEID